MKALFDQATDQGLFLAIFLLPLFALPFTACPTPDPESPNQFPDCIHSHRSCKRNFYQIMLNCGKASFPAGFNFPLGK